MSIITPFRHRFYDNSGLPLAGGKVYTYEAGTTTAKDSYTDSTGTVPNTNPIILDSKGEANIWTSGLYKINVTDLVDVQITGYPVDNIGGGQSSYDIAGFISGKPTASQIILYLPMVRAVTFDVNLALSKGAASVAATASTTFDIAKNGTNFGTMVFALGATTATFVAAVQPAFAIGDVLSVTAPASADATLANIGFILAGQATP
jgi:hypothetical protein